METLALLGPWPQPPALTRAELELLGSAVEVTVLAEGVPPPTDATALLVDADGPAEALHELLAFDAECLPPLILAARRPENVPDGVRRRAVAVVGMPLDEPELLSAFHAVAFPGTFISRNLMARLLATARGVTELTAREHEVLLLMAEGCSDSAIARRLFIGAATVHSHTRRIREKLGAENRAHAVALASRHGLLSGAVGTVSP